MLPQGLPRVPRGGPGWFSFNAQEVVAMMVVDNCCCVVPLAVECVRSDDLAMQVPESLEQRAHRVELAGRSVVADLGLADDHTGVVEHAGEQLHLVRLCAR